MGYEERERGHYLMPPPGEQRETTPHLLRRFSLGQDSPPHGHDRVGGQDQGTPTLPLREELTPDLIRDRTATRFGQGITSVCPPRILLFAIAPTRFRPSLKGRFEHR